MIDQYVFACKSELFNIFARFSKYKFLADEINSLISVIKVSGHFLISHSECIV